MTLEEQLKEIQCRLDKISVYKQIQLLTVLPTKKIINDKGIMQEVLNEIIAFAGSRIIEIETNRSVELTVSQANQVFSDEEVKVLKHVVKRLTISTTSGKPVEPKSTELVQPEKKIKGKPVFKQVEESVNVIKQGSMVKIITVGNIEPVRMRNNVSAYDVGTVLSVNNDMLRIKHFITNEVFTIPIGDVE